MFRFIPETMPEMTMGRIVLQVVFSYFSIQTVLSVVRIVTSDPGYIDPSYKYPQKPDGMAPIEKLRTYNMNLFKKNNLYDFTIEGSDDEEDRKLID